jgi:hypothetical protein
LITLLLIGCGGAVKKPAPPPPVAKTAPASDDKSGFAQGDFGVVHSDRMGISFPLPDKAQWGIIDRDDLNGGWILASHMATGTIVRARRFYETTLAGRKECDLRAQQVGALPKPEEIELRYQVLVDEPLHRPKGWDGRRWVAFQPMPDGRLAGQVVLIAGRQHACLIVQVTTMVKSDTDTDALADRLELFSTRTVGAVTVDTAKEPDPILPAPPPKGTVITPGTSP